MRTFLVLLLSAAFGVCAQTPTPWRVSMWGNSGNYSFVNAPATSGYLASFMFPQAKKGSAPAFLTTTSVATILGNQLNKNVSVTFKLDTTGAPLFRYGGQGEWNMGSLPPNARIYFSTSSEVYNLKKAEQTPHAYWWSSTGWTIISSNTGTATLSALISPTNWSNAKGQVASSFPTEFSSAASNIRQIGLSFGGGSFHDVSIAVISRTGSATFNLLSYNTQ